MEGKKNLPFPRNIIQWNSIWKFYFIWENGYVWLKFIYCIIRGLWPRVEKYFFYLYDTEEYGIVKEGPWKGRI